MNSYVHTLCSWLRILMLRAAVATTTYVQMKYHQSRYGPMDIKIVAGDTGILSHLEEDASRVVGGGGIVPLNIVLYHGIAVHSFEPAHQGSTLR